MVTAGRADFFVSYTGADEAWATWVAEVLETAGQTVSVQAWDSPAGTNFVTWISEQMQTADRTIAICSPTYFASHWATQEWTGALADRKILPLRVVDCPLPKVLTTIAYRDLFDLSEAAARTVLLEAVGLTKVVRRSTGFPGTSPAPFPARLPEIFEAPSRNRHFTGRQDLLERVRSELVGGGPVAVTAMHGMGGVGKSQLAIEYAHRYAASYSLVWWVDAEEATLVGEQLAALAASLSLPATGQVTTDAAAVAGWLRRNGGWLLLFDNAENPAALAPWLSDGPGHTLVTSRHHSWTQLATAIEIDVLSRTESVELLTRRVPGISPTDADAIANVMGDLPLGLEQAAAYLGTTRQSPAKYLQHFRDRRTSMLARGEDVAYGGTIDTAWSLALDHLPSSDPAAVQLLEICAQLGPDPIPLALFLDHPELLDPPLRDVVEADDLDDTIAAALSYSLARRDGDTIQLHRLVAAAIRAHQMPDHTEAAAVTARSLLVAHSPDEPAENPETWPRWTELLPHLLNTPAFDLEKETLVRDEAAIYLLLNAAWALNRRGDAKAAFALSSTVHSAVQATLDDGNLLTLDATFYFALDLWALGNFERARQLHEVALEGFRRRHGDDHPNTLAAANGLGLALSSMGHFERARQLHEDALARRRLRLGDDHRETLASAHNLASTLSSLGESEQARRLTEETLARRRRVVGDDHPDTLMTAGNLAAILKRSGELERARSIMEDTLARRRRVLGDEHPDTVTSASNLAALLRQMGEVEEAERLEAEVRARRGES